MTCSFSTWYTGDPEGLRRPEYSSSLSGPLRGDCGVGEGGDEGGKAAALLVFSMPSSSAESLLSSAGSSLDLVDEPSNMVLISLRTAVSVDDYVGTVGKRFSELEYHVENALYFHFSFASCKHR